MLPTFQIIQPVRSRFQSSLGKVLFASVSTVQLATDHTRCFFINRIFAHITPSSIVKDFQIPLTALSKSDLFELWWEKDNILNWCMYIGAI